MALIEYPICGMRGRLADAEMIKLHNLANTGEIYSAGKAELTCQLPEGHTDDEDDQHIQWVAEQRFGEVTQDWWASWLDVDGLRDEAAMFTGPGCPTTLDEGEDPDGGRIVWQCVLLAGHVPYHGDDLHMTAEGAEFCSSTRLAWRGTPVGDADSGDRHSMH
ncbi:hypothetical protein [Streptomyces sp. enrichment culture]|uniref:hypothetical protein n=1 Tax=Streptomyces sp. enrichment culture TaxID=1795815 RepID=UPI003F547166